MSRHDQVRQQRLRRGGDGVAVDLAQLAQNAVGPEIAEKIELVTPRGLRAPVREVDDHALIDAVDGRMRRVDEALQSFRQPMIAPGLAAVAVHPLLDHDPAAIIGDDEAV
jgi:hypothetical protein